MIALLLRASPFARSAPPPRPVLEPPGLPPTNLHVMRTIQLIPTSSRLAVAAVALLLLTTNSSEFHPLSADESPARPLIEVDGGELSINGTKLPSPWQTQDLLQLLGQPSRMILSVDDGGVGGLTDVPHRANALVWDDLGVSADRSPGPARDGASISWTDPVRLISLTLAIDSRASIFRPRSAFSGTFVVDGAAVAAELTLEEINQGRDAHPFEPVPRDILRAQERVVGEIRVQIVPVREDEATGDKHFRRVFIGPPK